MVVGFGRYPEKRPRGLNVDAQGAFKLSDLMAVWGYKQGYTDDQVLGAVQKNMYRGNEQRFILDVDNYGEATIRVKERRGDRGAATWSAGVQWEEDKSTPPWRDEGDAWAASSWTPNTAAASTGKTAFGSVGKKTQAKQYTAARADAPSADHVRTSAAQLRPNDIAGSEQGPDPPGEKPGKFWQVFQDGGDIWYYYEGPLGKWWCQDKFEMPEPFIEDD